MIFCIQGCSLSQSKINAYNLNSINLPLLIPLRAKDTAILHYTLLLSVPGWRWLRKQIQLFYLIFTSACWRSSLGVLARGHFSWKEWVLLYFHSLPVIQSQVAVGEDWISVLWSSRWQCDSLIQLLFCFVCWGVQTKISRQSFWIALIWQLQTRHSRKQ